MSKSTLLDNSAGGICIEYTLLQLTLQLITASRSKWPFSKNDSLKRLCNSNYRAAVWSRTTAPQCEEELGYESSLLTLGIVVYK